MKHQARFSSSRMFLLGITAVLLSLVSCDSHSTAQKSNKALEGEISTLLLEDKDLKAAQIISASALPSPALDRLLTEAVHSARYISAIALLEKGANAMTRCGEDLPLLLWTITHGRPALSHILLDHGAIPESRTQDGVSALSLAIRHKRTPLARRLISLGARVNPISAQTIPPLVTAIRSENLLLRTELLAQGADPNVSHPSGVSLLAQALLDRDFTLTEQLIRSGADVTTPLPDGERPLHKVISAGRLDLAELCLVKGSEPDSLDQDGLRPLESALRSRQFSTAALLLDHGANPNHSLAPALKRQDRAALTLLADYGANLATATFPAREAPICHAVRTNDSELLRLCLNKGASVRARPIEDQSLLALSVSTGNLVVMEGLLEAGADPNVRLRRPVSEAFRSHKNGKKFDWFLRNDSRITLLMMASNSGDIELARMLLKHGARTNVKSGNVGFWPLNFATRHADIPMIRLILGADPHREERKIVVDLSDQTLKVFNYEGDVIFTSKCSTGKKGHRTRKGTFAITNKYRDWTSTIYDSKMPYFQRLSSSDFGFHTGHVPGYPASHGCIRLPNSKAKALFKLTRRGDRVIIKS